MNWEYTVGRTHYCASQKEQPHDRPLPIGRKYPAYFNNQQWTYNNLLEQMGYIAPVM